MLARRRREIAAKGEAFDVVLAPEPPIDPLADADGAAETFDRYAAAGATRLNLRLRSESLPHYLEQLEAAADVGARTGWA